MPKRAAVVLAATAAACGAPDSRPAQTQQSSTGLSRSSSCDRSSSRPAARSDVNGDGYADVAFTAAKESTDQSQSQDSAVIVLQGGAKGLITQGFQLFDRHTAGLPGPDSPGAGFAGATALLDTPPRTVRRS